MNGAIANADYLSLRIRKSLPKLSSGCHRVISKFKSSCVDIDRNNFAMIICFDLWTNLSLVNQIATLGKFLFTIARLTNCHNCYFSAIALYLAFIAN